MPKIYLWAVKTGWSSGDVMGFAMAEDGHVLAEHLSSNEDWAMHDLGLGSDWKHDDYHEHYPDGSFELEWVSDPDNHEGWKAAFEKNQKLKEEDEKNGP